MDVFPRFSTQQDTNAIGIVVKTVNDEQIQITLPRDIPVAQLKTRVKDSTSIPEDRQRLIYRGRVLEDDQSLDAYNVEDGHTIHMVARPQNYQALQQSASAASSSRSSNTEARDDARRASTATLLPTLTALTDSLLADRAPHLAGRGAAMDNPSEATNLEHIRQSLLTMHTLMSTMQSAQRGSVPEVEELAEQLEHKESDGASAGSSQAQPLSQRRFFQGQWLDVKDTVDQWLEATVLSVRGSKLLIHYNGWPSRWDEWIESSSPRIAPFRTRTAHTLNTVTQSPSPNIRPDNAPSTGINDVRLLLPPMVSLMQRTLSALQELTNLYAHHQLHAPQDPAFVRASADAAPMANDMPWDAVPVCDTPPEAWTENETQRAQLLASELAPLCDRFGRALTDLSPHLHRLSAPPVDSNASENAAANVLSRVFLQGRGLTSTRDRDTNADRAYRQLISSSSRPGLPGGLGPNHLDIHIHAILTPTARGTSSSTDAASAGGLTSASGASPQGSVPALGALRRFGRQLDHAPRSAASLRSSLDVINPIPAPAPVTAPSAPSTAASIESSADPSPSIPASEAAAVSILTETQELQTNVQPEPGAAEQRGRDSEGEEADDERRVNRFYDRFRRLFFDNGQS